MKKQRIFKIKVETKSTKEIYTLISGDNYKSFEEHFVDILSYFTEKWMYDDSIIGKGHCLGRKLKCNILEIEQADEKFVSYGGLKTCEESKYDKEVKDHNRHSKTDRCKCLNEIYFTKKSKKYLDDLLAKYQIIGD